MHTNTKRAKTWEICTNHSLVIADGIIGGLAAKYKYGMIGIQ